MSRTIHTRSQSVTLLTPIEAGEHDPPMQEWLALPVGPPCPVCGGGHWGTINPIGYFPVRICSAPGCQTKFRPEPNLHMIHSITEALLGREIRLGGRYLDEETPPCPPTPMK